MNLHGRKRSRIAVGRQWNHILITVYGRLLKKKSYLRLKSGRIDTSLLLARNYLTQHTIGPVCTGVTSLDISNMKDGDYAGLALLQKILALQVLK